MALAMGTKRYLTLAEAATRLNVTPGALRMAANRGSLDVEKYGKVWLTTETAIERYRTNHLGRPGRKPTQTKGHA
jgi:hypothetical protein